MCKTSITKAERLIFMGDVNAAQEAVVVAITSLDKAAEKGIIHPNNAARRKSRLMKKFNQLQAQAPSAPAVTKPKAAKPKPKAKAAKPKAKATKAKAAEAKAKPKATKAKAKAAKPKAKAAKPKAKATKAKPEKSKEKPPAKLDSEG
jgi:ribosomal protein S20